MLRKKIMAATVLACTLVLLSTGCSRVTSESEIADQTETETMTEEEKDVVQKIKGITNYTVSASALNGKDSETAKEAIKSMIMENVKTNDTSILGIELDTSLVDPAKCDNYVIKFNVSCVDASNQNTNVTIDRNLLLVEQSVADKMVNDGSIVLGYEKQKIKETEKQTSKETKQTESQTNKETEKHETVAAETRETKETEKKEEKTRETQKPLETNRGSSVSVTERQETEAIVHTHHYTSKITTKPTCTEDGIRTYTCACGYSYTEAVPATGHAYDNGVITTEPTCTSEGVKTFTCANCGKTYTEPVSKSAHNWVISTEKVWVNDDNGGHYENISKSVCSVCGTVQ